MPDNGNYFECMMVITCKSGSSAAAALKAADAAATILGDAVGCSREKLPLLLLFVLFPIIALGEDLLLFPFWDPCKACSAWAGVLVNCLGDTLWVSL